MSNPIFWLYFDPDAKRRAQDIIHSLLKPGLRDELGFGIIRDAFSDYFFPGIITTQTEIKYFILLSIIYDGLKRKVRLFKKRDDIIRERERMEIRLCNFLCEKYRKLESSPKVKKVRVSKNS